MNIPKQQVITRDNVPVTIDGVLFFRVENAAEAIIMVQDYRYMIAQYSQTSLRDVIGQMTLDQLLTEREEIAKSIEQHVEKDTKGWGLEVTGLRIQDIDMPEELKKMMSRQASAEREKRATITKAEGDKEAAVNLALAAKTMAESPGAMQLRTLQTIDGLGPTASNTVVLAVPIEVLENFAALKRSLQGLGRPDSSTSDRFSDSASLMRMAGWARFLRDVVRGDEITRFGLIAIVRARSPSDRSPAPRLRLRDYELPGRRIIPSRPGGPRAGLPGFPPGDANWRSASTGEAWSGIGVLSPIRVNRQNDRSKLPRQPGCA